MKIAIVGAGGVGGYTGAKLLKTGKNHVGFIARGEHLKAIRKKGLTIIDEDEIFNVTPDFITDNPTDEGFFDLVIFCVKSYDLKNAASLIKNNITDKTYLMPILNGVDHDLKLKEIYPKNPILNSSVYILSNIKEPGVIKKYGNTFFLVFGSRFVKKENLQKLKKLFDEAGLKNKLTDNIEFETWKKYLFISSFAVMTSFYKKPVGWIIQEKKEQLNKLLNEIVSVANKKGISLDERNIQSVLKQAQNIPYKSKTSMQIDFEKGKQNELEALCGYIINEAEKENVSVPLMKRYYESLILNT